MYLERAGRASREFDFQWLRAPTRSTTRFFCTTSTVCRRVYFATPPHIVRDTFHEVTALTRLTGQLGVLPSQSLRFLRLNLSTDVYRSRTIPPRETQECISVRHLRQNNHQEGMRSSASCAAPYFSCLWRTSLQSFCCMCFPCGHGVNSY